MIWFVAVVVVLAVGAVVAVAVGRGEAMRPVYDDRPDALVPAEELTGASLRSVRFSVGLRGYRMDEVDALLARLAHQLDREREPEPDPPSGRERERDAEDPR